MSNKRTKPLIGIILDDDEINVLFTNEPAFEDVDVIIINTDSSGADESEIVHLPPKHRLFGSKATVKIDRPELLRDSVFDYARTAVQQSDHRE